MATRWSDASEAALNAVLGDHLDNRDSRLAIDMAFFDRGRRLTARPRRTASRLSWCTAWPAPNTAGPFLGRPTTTTGDAWRGSTA